jgi:hypothetical protein
MSELVSRRYRLTETSPRLLSMRPQRLASLLIGFTLVVAACGGGATDTATPAESSSTIGTGDSASDTAVPSTEPQTPAVTGQTDETAQTATERPAPDPTREIAPDFDLLLSDGSTFVLSEETRPVFMVFWAEW